MFSYRGITNLNYTHSTVSVFADIALIVNGPDDLQKMIAINLFIKTEINICNIHSYIIKNSIIKSNLLMWLIKSTYLNKT